MSARKSAKKRRPGERVHPEPKPRLRLLKSSSECSTPEVVAELSHGVKAVLRKLRRQRQTGAGDDTPEAA